MLFLGHQCQAEGLPAAKANLYRCQHRQISLTSPDIWWHCAAGCISLERKTKPMVTPGLRYISGSRALGSTIGRFLLSLGVRQEKCPPASYHALTME